MAVAVRDWSPRLAGDKVILFDVGCFPWHGSIELSVLTALELDTDPLLAHPSETAAWQHYRFAGWGGGSELGRQMQDAYIAAADRPAVVAEFLRACATAVSDVGVVVALNHWPRDGRFAVRVMHPDDGQDFYPPAS